MLKRPELRDGFQGKVFKGNVMGKTCMGACLFSDWLMDFRKSLCCFLCLIISLDI